MIRIIYGALVAMVQPDLKRLIAYSSVARLGNVVLGIFAFSTISVRAPDVPDGRTMAFPPVRSFLASGCCMTGATPEIREFGGLATPMPVLMSFS